MSDEPEQPIFDNDFIYDLSQAMAETAAHMEKTGKTDSKTYHDLTNLRKRASAQISATETPEDTTRRHKVTQEREAMTDREVGLSDRLEFMVGGKSIGHIIMPSEGTEEQRKALADHIHGIILNWGTSRNG